MITSQSRRCTWETAAPVGWRMRRFAVLWTLAVVLAVPSGSPAATPDGGRPCGTKGLHGERLSVWVVGDPISCAKARRVVHGPCNDRRPWTCLGLRPPDPIMVWLRTTELFREHPSTAIEARRPTRSCSARRVSRDAWRRSRRLGGFPTRRQMLADDLIACSQMEGMRRREVRRLLPGVYESDRFGDSWYLGDERRLFQLDAEYLAVTYTRRHVVEAVAID